MQIDRVGEILQSVLSIVACDVEDTARKAAEKVRSRVYSFVLLVRGLGFRVLSRRFRVYEEVVCFFAFPTTYVYVHEVSFI